MVRKRDDHVGEAILRANDSQKKPRAEPGLFNNEVRNTISTSLPQDNNHLEIPVADGEGLQNGVCGVEKATSHDVTCGMSKVEPLVTCEFMGNSFKRNLDEVWSSLMEKNVSRVGIYGMGGVGKTEIAKCIHNKFLEDPNYGDVRWVTVSPNFSIDKLQKDIAKAVDLDLSDEEDVNIRAAKLSRNLTKKKKFVIILDDVWSYIPLRTVGILDGLDGCKIVFTTRSLDVCQMMKCQKNVKVGCLLGGEAWELFVNELGTDSSFSGEIETIAKSIVERCGGLPLMIISVARRMRAASFTSTHQWRNTLEEMNGSKINGAYMEVFHKLKLSYDHLENQSLQQCLLYCALFDKLNIFDKISNREKLIDHMIAEKIIDGMNSRQAKFDRGQVLLDKLHHACLLEYDKGLHLHELVRKMAFQMMNEDCPSIIEIGEQIKYIPDRQHHLENVVRISFTKSDHTFIHSNYFPRCSSVSTLLLHNNEKLESMEDAFFDRFRRLKVLNLSGSRIVTLPNSVSCLEDLRALFLRRCRKLRHIPSLAKLESLEVLDLYDCEAVEEVPEGVELLSNLRYLNLCYSGIYELRAGILTRLLHLQYLAFNRPSMTISAEEVADLPKLEFLIWCFNDVGELYAYLHESQRRSLIKYFLYVGQYDVIFSNGIEEEPSDRELFLCKCSISRTLLIQNGIQTLTLRLVSIDGASGLCLINAVGVNSSEIELKSLDIQFVDGIEYLFNVWSSPSILGSIVRIELGHLDQLRDLFGRERDNRVPPPKTIPDAATFFNLRTFTMESCATMKKLFPSDLVANLKNLVEIAVSECSEMEEIIAAPEQETTDSVSHSNFNQSLQLSLPKLKYLSLVELPKLKSICSAQMKCDSLEYVTISNCEKIERIPVSLPLPSLKILEVLPESWWKSVHWAVPDQKDALRPRFIRW